MKSEHHFRVTYDGPALQAHEMDVRELAPALMAMADLLKAANAALYGDKAGVKVSVKGSFKTGSFGIDMVFLQDFMTQLTELFSGKEASATANAIQILSGVGIVGGGGVIGFLRWLKGRRVLRAETRGNRTQVFADGGESYDLSPGDWVLVQDKAVRRELQNILKPLETDGIDRFYAGPREQAEVGIDAAELAWFAPTGETEDIVTDATSRKMLLVESAVFKDGNKWRLSDGSLTFHASLDDVEFNARIDGGQERFGKGDVLIVDLRIVQTVANGELHNRYSVERVVEHRAPLQRPLL